MKRRSFTLIETMICLSLLSLLLGSLFFWYQHISIQKSKLHAVKWPILEERFAQQRLNTVLRTTQKELFFSPTKDQLFFLFQRGSHPEPLLGGTVLGCLFYDENNHSLYLRIWPNPIDGEILEEPTQVLKILDRIDHAEFKFYSPEDRFKLAVSPGEVGKEKPETGWQSLWKKEYETLPALIKIQLRRNEHEVEYLFDLDQPILYPFEVT